MCKVTVCKVRHAPDRISRFPEALILRKIAHFLKPGTRWQSSGTEHPEGAKNLEFARARIVLMDGHEAGTGQWREPIVADFLIGAHDMVQCDGLLTRDL